MKELVRIVIRLLAIYAVFLVANSIPNTVAYVMMQIQFAAQLTQNQPTVPVAAFIVSWIVYVAFVALMWTKAEAIASMVLRHGGKEATLNADLNYQRAVSI